MTARTLRLPKRWAEHAHHGGDPDQARKFVASNHRAVLMTRRSAGGLQTSPVLVGIDSDGKVGISSRETADQVRNLPRHPTATVPQALRVDDVRVYQ
jgi:hypothetical protein